MRISFAAPTRLQLRGLACWTERPGIGDVNIHLLAIEDVRFGIAEPINDLQDTCIDSLGGIPSQRLLWNHVRLEAHKFQWKAKLAIPAQICNRICSRPHPPCVTFIDVSANVKLCAAAEDH